MHREKKQKRSKNKYGTTLSFPFSFGLARRFRLRATTRYLTNPNGFNLRAVTDGYASWRRAATALKSILSKRHLQNPLRERRLFRSERASLSSAAPKQETHLRHGFAPTTTGSAKSLRLASRGKLQSTEEKKRRKKRAVQTSIPPCFPSAPLPATTRYPRTSIKARYQ